MIELSWGAATHAGRRRPRNEDAYLASGSVFAVADGMGGHAAGDVAANLAVDQLRVLAVAAAPDRTAVLEAIRKADADVVAAAIDQRAEMGTTLCGIAVLDGPPDRLMVFNVGDSRVYRVRSGELQQLTRDHSVVQELIDSRRLDEASAATHPDRHIITRSLGVGVPLEVDWWPIIPWRGDRFLITSDGLTKEVNDAAIVELIASKGPPQAAADALVSAALEAGGGDNVTVVVVSVLAADPADPSLDDPLDADTTPRGDDPRVKDSPLTGGWANT